MIGKGESQTARRPGTSQHRRLAASVLLVGLGVAALTWTTFDHGRRPARLLDLALTTARRTADSIAEAIDEEARTVMAQVRELARELDSGRLTRETIEGAFRDRLAENPNLYGVGVSYAPLEAPERDLFSPYWKRSEGEILRTQVEETYDYSQPDDAAPGGIRTNWYHEPMEHGAAWAEPNYGTVGGTFTVTYGERVRLAAEAGRAAVVFGDFSVGRLRELLSRFRIGITGYALLISQGGITIAHPNPAYPGQRTADLAEESAVLHSIPGTEGGSEALAVEEDYSGRTFHLLSTRVPSTDWLLVTVFAQDEIVPANSAERRARTAILLSSFPLVLGAAGVLFRGRPQRAWVVAITISAFFVAGIGLEWHWSLRFPPEFDNEYPIYDTAAANAVLARLLPAGPRVDEETEHEIGQRIPTGVFVQSAKFLGAHNVAVTGYVWQRSIDAELAGVVFPEAEEITMTCVAATDVFTRWYFEANLRQSFDYATYPIDRERIWIRMWPTGFREDATLVPDFRSYDNITPTARPGIEEDFVLEGWECIGTHFSYRLNSYRVDFGDPAYAAHNDRPELYFNIDVKRKFLGPFVSDLMPMLVVAILLFAILMIQTRRDDERLLGFSASTVLSYCSGLFFVLIISHVYVRQKLAVPQIIYIEWFFFTMYGLLLLLSLNAIRFARGVRARFCGVEQTEALTLAYWPLALGVLFLLTLVTFR